MKKAILGCFYILFILSFFLFITPINAQNDEEESAPIVEPTPAPTIEPTTPPAEEPAPTPQAEEATPAPTEEPTPEPTIEPAPTPQVEEPVPAPTEEPTPTPQAEEPAPTTTTEEPISSEEESAGIVGEDEDCVICSDYCDVETEEALTVEDLDIQLSIDEIINPIGPIWSRVLSKTFQPKNQAEMNKVKAYKKSLLKVIDKDIKLIKKGKKGKHVQSYKTNSDGSITVKLKTNDKKNKSKSLKNKKEATTKLQITCALNPGNNPSGKLCKETKYIKRLNRNGIPIEPFEFIELPETIISSCNDQCAICNKHISKNNTRNGYTETFACRLKDKTLDDKDVECSPGDGSGGLVGNPDLGKTSKPDNSSCNNNCKIVCGNNPACDENKSCNKVFGVDEKGFPKDELKCVCKKDKNGCAKNENWDQENCSCYECKNNNDCADNYAKKFCNIEKRTCYECNKNDECDRKKCDVGINTCICNENKNLCPSNLQIPDAIYSCNPAYKKDEEHPEGLRGLCERKNCTKDADCESNPKSTKCNQATNECVVP